MRRGEIWTAAGGPDYSGKPRPVVIIQSDSFDTTNSIAICGFTTVGAETPLFRLSIAPDAANGLHQDSWLMIDKLAAIPRGKLGRRIGRLNDADIDRANDAIMIFLGLAGR